MRHSRGFATIFFSLLVLSSIASAEIKIKVIDPQDAVVAHAQVQLLQAGDAAPADVQSTSAEGVATFREMASSLYRVQVLAPGFAAETVDLSSKSETVTIRLRVAAAAENVVVTATRTPVLSQAAGADVDSLSSGQLEVMRPVAADDAVRFLPGAVVNTAGQRGGISSLFVRGGSLPTTKSSSMVWPSMFRDKRLISARCRWCKRIVWNSCGARRALCMGQTQ